MKKRTLFLLLILCGLVAGITHKIPTGNPTVLQKDGITSLARDGQTQRSSGDAATTSVIPLAGKKSFQELKRDFVSLTPEQISARIAEITQTIEHNDLINRANAGQLNQSEWQELDQDLSDLNALHAARVEHLIGGRHTS